MNNYLLIGGFTPDADNSKIIKYILNNNKNILFFPTASKDSDNVIKNFYTLFKDYDACIDVAYLYNNPVSRNELILKIESNDILFFSGGNTKFLVDKLIEYDLYDYLKETSKLICGVSAGAIMISKYGLGDSSSYKDNGHVYNYKFQKGLGLLDIIICPHYDNEDLVCFNDYLKEFETDAYAIENETAIHFYLNNVNVIKSIKSKSIYKFIRSEGYKMKSLYENNKIAVLGPKGTFCDIACNKFLNKKQIDLDINYYPSIKKTIEAIQSDGFGVLPFENTLDGYVVETIDVLINKNYQIIADVDTKVEFAFVSNAKDIKDVKSVYVQFKTKAECIDFLTVKNDFDLIVTESNIQSLDNLLASDNTYGAIIPIHKLDDIDFNIVIKNISDKDNNSTRFIVVTNKEIKSDFGQDIKISLCVFFKEDRPGLLFEVLKLFSNYGLNLTSIISRPTKEGLGKYNFYIEVLLKSEEINNIYKCIKEIEESEIYETKVLGVYSSL